MRQFSAGRRGFKPRLRYLFRVNPRNCLNCSLTTMDNTNASGVQWRPGLILTTCRFYLMHAALLWRVMLPLIILGVLFHLAMLFIFNLRVPSASWSFDTVGGIYAQSPPNSAGVKAWAPSAADVEDVTDWTLWGVGVKHSFLNSYLIWLAMCPLAVTIVQLRRGMNVTARGVWHQTLRRASSVLGAYFFLGIFGMGSLFVIQSSLMTLALGISTLIPIILITVSILFLYFMVRWSFYNHTILNENLTVIAAFRRSHELTRGITGLGCCILHLGLDYVTRVVATTLFGFTLLVFSEILPEFAPIREVLLVPQFFLFFHGGWAQITFAQVPPWWTIVAIVAVKALIAAILSLVWTFVITELYLKRVSVTSSVQAAC